MLEPPIHWRHADAYDYLSFRQVLPRPRVRTAQAEIRQELLQAREMLLHIEQVATSGTLDERVAQDLRNFITIIRSYASLVHGAFTEGRTLDAGDLAALRTASRRAWELSEDVLWHDPAPERTSIFDAGDSLRALLPLLRAALPARIALELDAEPGPFPVCGCPLQLDRALINLALQARDAIEGPGTLHLGIQPGTFRNGQPSVHITLKDTGTGLPEDLLDAHRTPPTSLAGPAQGQGLASARAVLSSMGGFLRVDARPGHGTLVTLLLPAQAAVPEAATA